MPFVPSFVPKDWRDLPDQTTPLTRASLQDLENRVYTAAGTDAYNQAVAQADADSNAALAAGDAATLASANAHSDAGDLTLSNRLTVDESPPYCIVQRAAAQSIAVNSTAPILWDTEVADPFNMHAPGAGTVVIPKAGVYQVSACGFINAPAAGGVYTVEPIVLKNGASSGLASFILGQPTAFQYGDWISMPLVLAVNDTLGLCIVQNGFAGGVNTSGSILPMLGVTYLGKA